LYNPVFIENYSPLRLFCSAAKSISRGVRTELPRSLTVLAFLKYHAFSAKISFVAEEPSVLKYLIKNTAVVLVLKKYRK